MEVLAFLVPLALMLGFIGLIGFLWSLKNGQYDDLDGAGWRAISDDEPIGDTEFVWDQKQTYRECPGLKQKGRLARPATRRTT